MTQTSIRDRVIDLADIPPAPDQLPQLWGAYLMPGSVHSLSGKTGLGKSTFMLNVVSALAEGKELWGIPTEQKRVLVVDMESGEIGRSIKVERLYADRPRVRGQLRFVPPPLKLPEEMDDLVSYAIDEKVALVVFDTVRRCFLVKDENDNAEVYRRVMPTPDALKAAGIASLLITHPTKSGVPGARGAGAQEDAVDVILSLSLRQEPTKDSMGVIALSVIKNRILGLEIPPLYLQRMGDDQFERVDNVEVDAIPLIAEKLSVRQRCMNDIHDYLAKQTSTVTFSALGKAMSEQGHSQSTIQRALTELERKHVIRKEKSGYILCDPMNEQ